MCVAAEIGATSCWKLQVVKPYLLLTLSVLNIKPRWSMRLVNKTRLVPIVGGNIPLKSQPILKAKRPKLGNLEAKRENSLFVEIPKE